MSLNAESFAKTALGKLNLNWSYTCGWDLNIQQTEAIGKLAEVFEWAINAATAESRSELSTLRRERDQAEEDSVVTALHSHVTELLKEIETLESQVRELTGAMKAQDEREAKAGELCGVSRELHGCDWPDAVAERVRELTARNEDLAESVDRHRTRAQRRMEPSS